jgi:transcription-repair coupling factor (superfamily II helicase)
VILDEAAITRFRQNYRLEFGAAGTDDPLYEAVSAGRKHQGMEHWLAFFHDRLETLFDYLPQGAVTLADDQMTPRGWPAGRRIADQYGHAARGAERRRGGWTRSTSPRRRGCFTLTTRPGTRPWRGGGADSPRCRDPRAPGVIDAGGRIGRDFAPERQQEKISLFGALAAHVAPRQKTGPVVASYSEGARERLTG